MKRLVTMMDAVGYVGLRGLLYSAGIGATIGTLFAPIAGTIYGAFVGGMVGFPLGIVGGIIVDVVTVLFFNPIADPAHYRRTLTVLGGVVGFLGTFFGFFILSSLYSVVSEDFITKVSNAISNGSILIYVILGLIAAASAAYVGHSYAGHYLGTDDEETSPATTGYETTTG